MKEAFFAKNTLGSGSAWDIAFSRDPEQRFIFMADGQNNRVRIIVRETLEEVTAFGDGGRQRAVGEGVKSCPRAGCGKSACPGSGQSGD